MAGEGLMRDIKVTFLAERVKAEEELFLMRGYEIPSIHQQGRSNTTRVISILGDYGKDYGELLAGRASH